MQAHAYIESFAARGVILWREGDSLKFRAPAGVLTPAVLARLKQAKPKILPVLPSSPENHIQTTSIGGDFIFWGKLYAKDPHLIDSFWSVEEITRRLNSAENFSSLLSYNAL